MRVDFNKKFRKQYQNSPLWVQKAVKERLLIFSQDKFASLLNNHGLKGKYRGCRSINIGGDWRAIFEELTNGDVCFLFLGTHSQLYK